MSFLVRRAILVLSQRIFCSSCLDFLLSISDFSSIFACIDFLVTVKLQFLVSNVLLYNIISKLSKYMISLDLRLHSEHTVKYMFKQHSELAFCFTHCSRTI